MFIVSQQRQKYTPEYRREAANLVIESQRPIAHVAKEIGVAPRFAASRRYSGVYFWRC
ncbi:transposase [Corynebacterium accolens]|uniref:transposase n=1 Tax=Corynebacterium accolens TaxID=38284 RepID=UPI00349F89CA